MQKRPLITLLVVAILGLTVATCTEAPVDVGNQERPLQRTRQPSGDLLVRAGTTTSSAPLARLEAEIESLAGDGSLIGGQANALLKKLEAFQMQAEAGRTGPVMALINALMTQVEDFVADGVRTPEQGQALTALAVGVRNTIDPGIVRTAFVPNTLGDDVSVLDLATGTVTGSISVGSSPNAAVFTPDGSTAYVANRVTTTSRSSMSPRPPYRPRSPPATAQRS